MGMGTARAGTGTLAGIRRRPRAPAPPLDTPRFGTCTTPLDRPATPHPSRAISPNSSPRRGPISAARSGGWFAASEAALRRRPKAANRGSVAKTRVRQTGIRSTIGAVRARSRRTRCGARFPRTIRNVRCTSTGTRARRRRFDSRLRATFAAASSPTRWDSERRSSSSCASSPTGTSPTRKTNGTRRTTRVFTSKAPSTRVPTSKAPSKAPSKARSRIRISSRTSTSP